MSIKRRLITGIVSIICLISCLAFANIYSLVMISQEYELAGEERFPQIQALAQIQSRFDSIRDTFQSIAAGGEDSASLKLREEHLHRQCDQMEAPLRTFGDIAEDDEEREWADEMLEMNRVLHDLGHNLSGPQFSQSLETAHSVLEEFNRILDEAIEEESEELEEGQETAGRHAHMAWFINSTLAIAAVIIAILLGIRQLRLILKPLREVRAAVDQLADGELNVKIDGCFPQEIKVLTDAFNKMTGALKCSDSDLRELNKELQAKVTELAAATEQAKQANAAKTSFLANMSHEIRTPMTAILGYTDLLSDPECAEEYRAEHVATIQRNGRHLLDIINDILDLSKIEANKIDIELIDCSILEAVEDVASLMRVKATEKGLNFNIDYTFPIPAQILSDPLRLRQILLNLVGNAIKFTRQGGVELMIRCDDSDGDNPSIRFEIADTGIGMSSEQVEKIFDPFSQADESTTRNYGGTGLGLTISKRLAEMLGGDIVVRSEIGKGSRFIVTIDPGPIQGLWIDGHNYDALHKPAPHKPNALTNNFDVSGRRLLLAEDGPDNQRLIGFLLRKVGYDVTVVEDGQKAVEAALQAVQEQQAFDVILMDMQMPVLDGYAATRELRRCGYTRPIIALTAHSMTGDSEKCLNAGCDGYATKPIEREVFLDLIYRYATEDCHRLAG